MPKINWRGVGQQCFFDPGKVKVAHCGICGSEMRVDRNVLGPTCFAEAMAGRKRWHDHFYCPNIGESWHQRIYELKWAVFSGKSLSHFSPADMKKFKRAAKKEILKLLKIHAAK